MQSQATRPQDLLSPTRSYIRRNSGPSPFRSRSPHLARITFRYATCHFIGFPTQSIVRGIGRFPELLDKEVHSA